MEELVSIIVPVYNAQDYLSRCLDSIIAQEYTDFELIIVDDGSTDGSGSICDDYARRDPRVAVIHKENSGVSDSRNTALQRARGTYIQFLDSDDWMTPDATKLLVRSARHSGSDLVIADFYRVVGDSLSHKGDIEREGLLTREEFANEMMENPADFYYGVLWNKLYKNEIIKEHQLRMDPDISWCEDFLFNLEYLRHCRSVYALHAPIYYYVKRKGSLVDQGWSFSNTIRMKLNVFDYYKQFYKEVYDKEDYDNIRLQVYRFFLASARDNFIPPAPLPGSKRLGSERSTVLAQAVDAPGIIMELYRYSKLLERYCETLGIRSSLSVNEIYILLYLSQDIAITSLREMSDISGMTRKAAAGAIARLVKKNYIKRENIRRGTFRLTVLEPAAPILEAFSTVQQDFDNARFSGFTPQEREQYLQLSRKIDSNLRGALRRISPSPKNSSE